MLDNLEKRGKAIIIEPSAIPFVSVIMPVRNEEDFIERSVGAVLDQDWPKEKMEVIVADGMSTDKTRDLIQEMIEKTSNLKLVDNQKKIAPTAINVACRHARGEIIVRVDGHCVIAPDYVRRCVEHLQNRPEIDCVGGPIETIGHSLVSRAISAGMSSNFGVGGSPFRTTKGKTLLVDTVAFPAYRRSIMQRAGEFDEELVRNQDDEYSYRMRKLGAKILLAEDIHSKYYSRGSLTKLWKQYYQYGYWKVRLLQKHPMQMRPRQFAPPLFAATLCVFLLLAIATPLGWWPLTMLVGSYAAANLIASFIAAAHTEWNYMLLLPIVFAILHLSYGFGFLNSLILFANRWGKNRQFVDTAY